MQVLSNMRLTGGPACLKYLLFAFNLVFVITGITLLCIGAVIQGVYHNYHHFLDDKYLSAPSLLIAIGVIIFLVSFLGCCGAVKENHCMVISFSILLGVIFVMELSGGIAGYVLKSDAIGVLTNKLNVTRRQYNNSTEITDLWDLVQNQLDCCGMNNYTDWHDVFNNTDLPVSCCTIEPGMKGILNCTALSTDVKIHQTGCIKAVGKFVRDHAAVIGGSGIGIAFIQLLGVVLSCLLANYIRKNYESV